METTALAVALTELLKRLLPKSLPSNYYILVCIVFVIGLTALDKYIPAYRTFVPGLVEALTATGLYGVASNIVKKRS